MNTFQTVVIGVFITLTIVGVGVFALYGGALGGSSVGPVVLWGTEDSGAMSSVLDQLRAQDKSFQDVQYIQKSTTSYEGDLVSAMAAGVGPDLFLVTQAQVSQFEDKIAIVPYKTVSQSAFVNSYIDEGQLFLTSSGALALPFLVDPMVMYYNKDMLSGTGVAQAPKFWNDFLALAPKITVLDPTRQVKLSAVALGTWPNINHAKEILAMLFIQAGDPITSRGAGGVLVSNLGYRGTGSVSGPAESALQFYTEFANPSKTTYSWNKSLPQSKDAFVGASTAVYFGLASEYQSLLSRNPNIKVGVAVVPQLTGNAARATFGVITGVAVSRSAPNYSGALLIAQKLTSQAGVTTLARVLPLPPVRRDVALDTSASAAASVFVESSLIARGWLDPNPQATDPLFQGMIESVISGKADPSAAVGDASAQLSQLLQGSTYR